MAQQRKWHLMHIGIDASRIAVSARTGTEHYTFELLAALAQRDHTNQYTLYCNQPPTNLPSFGNNMALRPIPFPRLWTHARLSAEVLRHPPEVLFIPAHVVPLGAPLAQLTRTVVTIHDLGYLHFPAAHTRAQRLYLRLSTLWSARVASNIIAISNTTRDDLVRYTGVARSKISVIYHGVGTQFKPASDDGIKTTLRRYNIHAPYVFYVGTVQPRKNLLRLIDAFAAHTQRNPTDATQLVIAGKHGWLSEAIERRAAELGIATRVQFTGYVADSDLPALYSGALAFVFPSLYEGFGMPVLEAMACGTPVLASNTSALREVAGDAAMLVDPTDTAGISNALSELIGNDTLRTILQQRGSAQAASFTWSRCAEQTLRVLDNSNGA